MKRWSTPRKIRIRGKLSEHWYCRQYDSEARKRIWRSTGATSKTAAIEQRRTWEILDRSGKLDEKNAKLSEAVKKWLEHKATSIDAGLEAYEIYSGHWVDFFPARTLVRGIQAADVERYFRSRALEVKGRTLNKERTLMRDLFRWAIQHGLCGNDPTATIKAFPVDTRAIRALTPAEEKALLAASDGAYKAKAKGMRNLGGRKGRKKTEKDDERSWEQGHKNPAWLYSDGLTVRHARADAMGLDRPREPGHPRAGGSDEERQRHHGPALAGCPGRAPEAQGGGPVGARASPPRAGKRSEGFPAGGETLEDPRVQVP